MRILAHLSDLHFGRIDPPVAQGLLLDLIENPPDLIIISGDIVQSALLGHFHAAAAFIDKLPCSLLVVPGNHDIPRYNLFSRFLGDPFARYRNFICDELNPFYLDEEIAVLGLNTARSWILDFSQGRINRRQLARVKEAFAGVACGVCRIIVTHHPFLPPPDAPNVRMVGRCRLALPVFAAAGVELLLSGHLHRGYAGELAARHEGGMGRMHAVQAATATSTRRRGEANAYNRLIIDPQTILCEARAWDGEKFIAVKHHRMIRHAPPMG